MSRKYRLNRWAAIVFSGAMIFAPLELAFAFSDLVPPRHLAKIVRPDEKAAPAVTWGKPQEGLAVGIGTIRISLKSPQWPIIEGYLENRGNAPIDGIIRGQSKFVVELDGAYYAQRDFGGPVWPLAAGERYGPITIDSHWFTNVPDLQHDHADEKPGDKPASAPVLTAGPHTLKIYFKPDRMSAGKPEIKPVASAEIRFNVSLTPYPTDEAVATFAREMRSSNSEIQRDAALAAGYLRLSGCGKALVEALKDEDPVIRRYAIESLAQIGDRSAVGPVHDILKDAKIDVRLAAASCLVELGQPLDVAWVIPIIKSHETNEFQNAIWLVRRQAGDKAVPSLIRCLDMDDPSVSSYYNYTLIWQIGACGGPKLQYHHDFDGKGTAAQVEENRHVLTQLREWLSQHEAKP